MQRPFDNNERSFLSVKQSRKRYELYLEQERVLKKSAQEQAKRMSAFDEIEEIKKKKQKLDLDN